MKPATTSPVRAAGSSTPEATIPAPLDDPLSYPGARPDRSWQLTGDRCAPFDGPVPERRHAVLAIGSNACPAQLARKLSGRPCSGDVIGLAVSVRGLTVRPSAHLGRSGYWPFAPAASLDPAAAGSAALCFLDDDQLPVLDATEPNYLRMRLDRSAHAVTAREQLPDGAVWVYVSRHGVVDDPRLPRWTDPAPTQHALLSALIPLLQLPTALAEPAALSAALRHDGDLAEQLSRKLKDAVRIRSAGLVEDPAP